MMIITKIQKRDGRIVDFEQEKITDAIFKALTATSQGNEKKAKKLSDRVVQILNRRFKGGEIPQVEQIQDIVEEVLILEGLVKAAKSYILYREQRRKIREAILTTEESVERIDQYIKQLDWEVKENANMAFSLQGLNHYAITHLIKKYWLNKIYPKEIRGAHESGDIYLDKLDTLGVYCSGWDLYDFLLKGFGGVSGKMESKPPKHFHSALGQIVNFIFTLSGEVAGAVSFSNFDTLLAPFIRYDNLNYQQVKQALQEFLFNMATPTRVGFQSLAWEELIVIKHKGKIKFVEIGKLIDEEFKKNSHRIIEQHPKSYAVENYDDYYTLSFNSQGKASWAKVKAFIRHKVPKDSQFLKIRTNRGEALVSPGHSLFSFEKFNEKFNPKPVSADNVKIAYDYRQLNPQNHFIALSKFEKKESKNEIDLIELIDEFPQLQKNVFVKINPTHTLSQIRKNILSQYQALHPFYVDFGIRDKGIWEDWLKRKSIRYDIWRKFGEDKKEIEFKLKNSEIWYPRNLKGKTLENFVKLCAWYIGEGHKGLSVPIYVSQSDLKNKKEILEILKELKSLGQVEISKGYSPKGNKVKKVYKIAGKGLLVELISLSCGTMAFNKVIPWYIFELSKPFQKIFIETLIKGEATEYKNYWDLSTTSRKLSLSLSLILAQNDIRFSIYTEKNSQKNRNWRDKLIIRIFKGKSYYGKKQYKVGDFEARVLLGKKKFKYERKYEYDISVDLPQENFAGGVGLLVFHNSPFSNITLDLKPSPVFAKQPVIVGGKPQKETYGEFEEEMKIFNKAFYEAMLEGDKNSRPFSFPIPTINITKDFPWDEPAFNGVFEASAKYGINYFANYIQSDMKPEDVKSMCPLGGREKVLIKSSRGRGLEYSSIKNIYKGNSKQNEYYVYSDGRFVKGKFNVFKNQEMIRVTLANNHQIEISKEHLNFVLEGENSKIKVLTGKELKPGMYLPYSMKIYKGKGGNRELGYLVGAYAGDGSFDEEGAVIFSLSKEKESVIEELQNIAEKYFGAHSTITPHHKTKLLTLRINSKTVVGLCKEFVAGKEKEKYYTPRVFEISEEFRKGVLEGHQATDGGGKYRIYTSSPKMVETLNMLAATLGTTTSLYEDSREGRLGENSNFAVFVYRLNRKRLKNIWFKKYGKLWVKIKSVQKLPYKADAYCFEVENDEPMFTVGTTGILTHNCRLRLDLTELHNRGGGGLFGSGSLTGSVSVITINLPRIGYLSKTKKEFFERLAKMMDLAKESLEIKRKVLESFIEKGLYPYSKFYLSGVKKIRGQYYGNHFSTIGLVGMNETLLNFIGENIGSKRGKRFALEVMDFMRERLVKYQKETGNIYNLEATPAESCGYKLCLKDKEKYPDIITAGTKKVPYYTNSTSLPVNYTDDLFEALELQDELLAKYTGGCVHHIFLGERMPDVNSAKKLVKKIFENFKLPYITLTPNFSICPSHGYLEGEHFFCPKCTIKQPCEVYSRIVGYLRPLSQWNAGKLAEYHQRKTFKIKKEI